MATPRHSPLFLRGSKCSERPDEFSRIRNVEKRATETGNCLKGHPLFWNILFKTYEAKETCKLLGRDAQPKKCDELIKEAEKLAAEFDRESVKYKEIIEECEQYGLKKK